MTEKFKIKTFGENLEQETENNLIALIEKSSKNPIELGTGRAAKVFSYEKENYCIKQIVNKKWEYSFNNIDQELKIHEEAIKLGVRSPELYMSVKSEAGDEFIVMEKITGVDLKKVKEKLITAPKELSSESFWDKLERMIKLLHDVNIHHRDLHEGNVMIDFKTGDPVIIDYGHAKKVYGDENPYIEENYPRFGEHTIFRGDLIRFEQFKRELKKIDKI